jgi:F-type H+-transporting ATPase subunit b
LAKVRRASTLHAKLEKVCSRAEIISERDPMNARQRMSAKGFAGALLATCVATAGTAAASEGGLVLLPDFTGKLPILIGLFALLIIPANAILFKPIFRVLDEREERTVGTRRRAEKIMKGAEETLASYERDVRAVRAEAEQARKLHAAAARKENASVTQAARAEADLQLERARLELDAALDQSRQILRADARSLANDAASRVLGRPL